MGGSVVINPSGDFHPRLEAVVSLKAGNSGDVGDVLKKKKKKSETYICSFCARVCRNAQALGGHMNVHRGDRTVAKQLVKLRNQKGENLKGTSAATLGFVVAAAATTTASGDPMTGEGEQAHQHEEVITPRGSSASSSSLPSPHSFAIASPLVVHPPRSLQQLPSKTRKRREAVDLELRLGFNPERLL